MTISSFVRLPGDEALPYRDTLLDESTAADEFSAALGADGQQLIVHRVERVRVKYRIGESLRSVHRVWVGDDRWFVSARMRATGGVALYDEARVQEQPCRPLRGVGFSERTQTVFWTYPNDRCLSGTDALSPANDAIAAAFPGGGLTVDIVGYNPERAVTASVSRVGEAPLGFAKLYAPDGFVAARRVLEWLGEASRDDAALRVPRLRGCDPVRRLLVVDAVDGVHQGGVSPVHVPRAFHGLGMSLARLHRLTPPTAPGALPRWSAFGDDELARAADVIGWARPALAAAAARVAAVLSVHRPEQSELVCLHSDMNSRNWLVRSDGVGLIDLDEASIGPPAVDLAGVLGWLRTRRLMRELSPARERELADAFATGYRRVRPAPRRRDLIWFQTAALLVERAMRAVTRVRPEQLACLDGLMLSANEQIQELVHA